MANDLAGKVAIITGGAGGIGKALAEELAARGCYLVLADINSELLEQTAAELRAGGAELDAKTVDVRDATQVQALVEGAHRELGRIDYIFNNAGVNVCAELRDTTLEDWNLLIDVNLRGVVHGVHAAYSIMREQGFGHIINTASAAGLIPAAAEGAYAATKHAVVGLSSTLRIEAASFGVKVSVVCPGLVDTPILDSTKYVKLGPDALEEDLAREARTASNSSPADSSRRRSESVLHRAHARRFDALWRLHRYAPATSLGVGRIAVRLFRRERTEDRLSSDELGANADDAQGVVVNTEICRPDAWCLPVDVHPSRVGEHLDLDVPAAIGAYNRRANVGSFVEPRHHGKPSQRRGRANQHHIEHAVGNAGFRRKHHSSPSPSTVTDAEVADFVLALVFPVDAQPDPRGLVLHLRAEHGLEVFGLAAAL